ncbi:MAG: sensor domain-containing diguanylate cyclase, partial [Acidimicrobiales bacterium]
VDDETWGELSAARRIDQPAFDDHDVSILRHIATETASALTNTERWAEIEKMALRDQLTGLANRHVLYAVLDEIFRRDPVDRQDCAVIMCDVDGLKIVNDGLGHEAGDRLLIDAAASLRSAIRDPERSTICRIGGDEFCVVIDGGALLTAHEVSDTIERLFARSGGPNETRSISCGIAFASADVPTRSDLLRAADENQYQTKRARRAARGEPIADAVRHDGDRRAIRD